METQMKSLLRYYL